MPFWLYQLKGSVVNKQLKGVVINMPWEVGQWLISKRVFSIETFGMMAWSCHTITLFLTNGVLVVLLRFARYKINTRHLVPKTKIHLNPCHQYLRSLIQALSVPYGQILRSPSVASMDQRQKIPRNLCKSEQRITPDNVHLNSEGATFPNCWPRMLRCSKKKQNAVSTVTVMQICS